MTGDQSKSMQECTEGAISGKLTFPAIVDRLTALGVERYHADYSRREITYYRPDGDSFVAATPYPAYPTASEFSPSAVEAAVRESQRGEHSFPDFIRKTMAAGCVGYFVQITGQRAIYFGRKGESHVEHFRSAPAD